MFFDAGKYPGHHIVGDINGVLESDWFRASDAAERIEGRRPGPHDPGFGDTVDYTASDQGVNVDLGDQDDVEQLGRFGVVPNISGGWAEGDQLEGVENAVGSRYNDNLWGDRGDNKLFGGLFNDHLWGSGGDDKLWGDYDAGSHWDYGRHFEDVMNGGHDDLIGGRGDDRLEGGVGADMIYGGWPDLPNSPPGYTSDAHGYKGDTASYARSNDGVTVDLSTADPMTGAVMPGGGHAEDDELYGIENLHGSVRADMLTGDDGPNYLRGSGYVYATPVARGNPSGTPMEVAQHQMFLRYFNHNKDNDTLMGGGGDDTLDGVRGNDRLWGGDGKDKLWGGQGNDLLRGGNHSDRLVGDLGTDTLVGGAGRDVLNGDGGGAAAILGLPHANDDEASYADSLDSNGDGMGVTVSLTTGTGMGDDAQGDVLYLGTIENLRGSMLDDMLTGDGQANHIWGLAGDDMIDGLAGDDTLDGGDGEDDIDGGTGNDMIMGGADADEIDGEAGDDTIHGNDGNDMIMGGAGNDTIDGGAGTDTIDGNADDDMIMGGTHNDTIMGGAGNDTIEGNNGDDNIDGGAGDDKLYGNAHSDTIMGGVGDDVIVGGNDTKGGTDAADMLYGDAGDDEIMGGLGDDMIWGGDGDDTLTGGFGGDTFYFGPGFGNDRVKDFANGSDSLDLTAFGFADPSVLQEVINNREQVTIGGVDAIELDFVHAGVQGTITLMGYEMSDDLEVGALFII